MINQPINLLIVDDHPIVVTGLRSILNNEEGIAIVAHALDGASAMNYLKEYDIDIVLLDINLPDISGIDLCKQIKKQFSNVQVLALSTFNDRSTVMNILQNGAMGYLLKNVQAEELVEAIKTVYARRLFVAADIQKMLSESAAEAAIEIPVLTRRELEILKYIADGLVTTQIADKLFISPLTIETHRRNLMHKFEVNNSPSLIKKAMKLRLI